MKGRELYDQLDAAKLAWLTRLPQDRLFRTAFKRLMMALTYMQVEFLHQAARQEYVLALKLFRACDEEEARVIVNLEEKYNFSTKSSMRELEQVLGREGFEAGRGFYQAVYPADGLPLVREMLVKKLEEPAKLNYAPAHCRLGFALKSREWHLKALQVNYYGSCHEIGMEYLETETHKEEGERLLRLAAEVGHSNSIHALYRYYSAKKHHLKYFFGGSAFMTLCDDPLPELAVDGMKGWNRYEFQNDFHLLDSEILEKLIQIGKGAFCYPSFTNELLSNTAGLVRLATLLYNPSFLHCQESTITAMCCCRFRFNFDQNITREIGRWVFASKDRSCWYRKGREKKCLIC
jgi:hypothetical protein